MTQLENGVALWFQNRNIIETSNDEYDDDQECKINATACWALHSLPVSDEETLVFPGGPMDAWADGEASDRYRRPKVDDNRVQDFLNNHRHVVSAIAHYVCWSGHLIAGQCTIEDIRVETTDNRPMITLDLRYENVRLRDGRFATLDDLSAELQAISRHYAAASEMNFGFVSLEERFE